MGRRRQRLDWKWDEQRQEFTTPSGRVISLAEIARLLADHRDCVIDFNGPWNGWKMRGAHLYPPGHGRNGPRLKPDTGKQLAQWIAEAGRLQAPVALASNRGAVSVRLVHDPVRRLLDDLAVKARLPRP